MKVNVIHADLNPCGGAEQLALATLQSLLEMGMQVDLAVAKAPDIGRMEKAFGDRVRRIFDRVKVRPLGRLPIELDPQTGTLACRPGAESAMQEYDMIVNTHGDMLPYFLPSFSSKLCITYCHFPVVAEYAACHSLVYLQSLVDLGLLDRNVLAVANSSNLFWRSFLEYYLLMLRNSLVATNSRFSRQAIVNTMTAGTHRMASEPIVISPPVCVDELSQAALSPSPRADCVLVVSRIHPSKKLENAIELARILKQRGIGKKMAIAGNLSADDTCGRKYYEQLLGMVKGYGLSDYVVIRPNVELGKLWSLMQRSKAYFHPMPEEPFGISVVEAMAAGLVPVVPSVGGPTEFVPREYQFRSLKEAADMISAALQASDKERLLISNSVRGFSLPAYTSRFSRFISEVLLAAPATATPYGQSATAATERAAASRSGLA
jgi:glycosyltransferase involved in cell wall biosynthesis